MPFITFSVDFGSAKFAVPTETAVAPAMRNSTASSPVAIPPIPITGIFTAWDASYTILTATGFTAGPEKPPVLLARTNFFLYISIFIPISVLMSDIASAPPASAARAISFILVTLGESFMMTGCLA